PTFASLLSSSWLFRCSGSSAIMSGKSLGIGIIGTGNISSAYLKAILGKDGMPGFPVLNVKALADMRPEAAQTRADEFGLKAKSIDALLADPEIDLIINLTIPRA